MEVVRRMEQEMVDVEAQSRAAKPAKRPVTLMLLSFWDYFVMDFLCLQFEDVVYKINKKGGLLGKDSKVAENYILKGITGMVVPGEMLAILGPSGSGKTTILTAMGGRLVGQLTGNITYNGNPFSNSMKQNIGFVTQDDVLYQHLTVTETLVFTALLRLPNTLSKQEKIAQAAAVVTELGLSRCKNSIVGGPMLRGISGGERKRVSIGQEMLVNPSLLFLDEPTSGLDSTTAQKIVTKLLELASAGRTIVMTIHQPSSRLFYMFHKVLLLSEGNSLYFGKGAEAMDYFSSIGYVPSVAMNPSDFLLDLANGISSNDANEDQNALKQVLIARYKSNLAEKMKAELHETKNQIQDGEEVEQFKRWNTNWGQQFSVLLKRGLKERKHESFSVVKISHVVVLAFILGMLTWQSDISHLQDQMGLLFFTTQFSCFFPLLQAIFAFPKERLMLQKERASGMYHLSSYFMANTVGDLPMELLPTVFVTITYWMAGLKPTAGHFLHTIAVILLCVLVSQGLGFALGAIVMDQKAATTLGTVIMLISLLAGGYFVEQVPGFIAWIKYVSLGHHTYKLLLGSQYKLNERYPCGLNSECLVGDFPGIKLTGLDGQLMSFVALAIMFVVYRLIHNKFQHDEI